MITPAEELKWVAIHSKTVLFDGRSADLIALTDITPASRPRKIASHWKANCVNLRKWKR